MGCLRGSKFTCILSCPPRKTGFPEILLRDVGERIDIGVEIGHVVGDSPNHRLRRVMA